MMQQSFVARKSDAGLVLITKLSDKFQIYIEESGNKTKVCLSANQH